MDNRAKIYVASSWRNEHQPAVVSELRKDGHNVYDFKDADGFQWSEIDPNWQQWTPEQYIAGLNHQAAGRGFNRDMAALASCDICVMVMPCGMSAGIEMGWAVGAGVPTIIYIPGLREPDLMIKMAHVITDQLHDVRDAVRHFAESRPLRSSRSFQNRVKPWLLECFGSNIAQDPVERNHRFIEEALELVQSCGCTKQECEMLVDYVFSRDAGEPKQETGGVEITLAALCLAHGIDKAQCGEDELMRIWKNIGKIREKQHSKPRHVYPSELKEYKR